MYSLCLYQMASKINSDIGQPTFDDYSNYIRWLAHTLETVQQLENITTLDFNSDFYTVEYVPSEAEMKLAINILGADIIQIYDNNKQFQTEPSIFGNRLWALYLVGVFAGCGLQIITVNMNYFAQYIGATSLQTTNMTTYFNLSQLFFSILWLWLSDIIGRKPIYILILSIYITASCLMLIPAGMNDKDM